MNNTVPCGTVLIVSGGYEIAYIQLNT